MKSNGTYTCTADISIDISNIQNKFYEILENTLADLTQDYLATVTDDADINESEFDGNDCIDIRTEIKETYNQTYFAATMETPEENDIDFSSDDFNEKDMTKYINEHLPAALKTALSSLHNNPVKVNRFEADLDTADLQPYEPDWDSMPGGYDDI